MSSINAVHGVPMAAQQQLLRVLRDWGFDLTVMSDCDTIPAQPVRFWHILLAWYTLTPKLKNMFLFALSSR